MDRITTTEQFFLKTARNIFQQLVLSTEWLLVVSIAVESGSGKTSLILALK
ncbi:MAG: hypothetical protein ABI045_02075 [Flavobacteriales bacterium]